MRSLIVSIVLMLLAAGGAYVGRPYVDQWLTPAATPSAKGKYQCSMHPQIVSDEPGICPICGMKLQRVDEPAAPALGRGKPLFYRNPMRPDVTSPVPVKDEMGMDYVPVYEADAIPSSVPGHAGFTLSPERQQLIGVTTAPVERRRLDDEIRAVGKVAYDPALYQAIVDYREAIAGQRQLGDAALPEAHAGAAAIVRSAALRLHQLGLSEQQVREITASGGRPVDLLLPGTSAWVYAQVYEYEMDTVRPGQAVTITTLAERGRNYTGRVVGVDPILDTTSRTARVRIQVPTPDASLRPETFVHTVIHVPSADTLTVPVDAVLHSGQQDIVFVVTTSGTFEPRAVRLGREANGAYEVLDGVAEGEQVVTSANFLIDSESRLRAALAAFSSKTPTAEPSR
jgi:hypothetical protein